ncbi:hypothetical protein [Cohnella nanjingensis]|uniref:Uncharacterized protein n=1 Tax=Cohnella nanjingensis TaxID=1387779 RepID=A0A7X0VI74_9BACL|nr:hypothetical protein [Cohnella nanjingensis]MBB6674905.1 hypothetical protein [Cohnella nanjingensis]
MFAWRETIPAAAGYFAEGSKDGIAFFVGGDFVFTEDYRDFGTPLPNILNDHGKESLFSALFSFFAE